VFRLAWATGQAVDVLRCASRDGFPGDLLKC
jgi:hypothetical protein